MPELNVVKIISNRVLKGTGSNAAERRKKSKSILKREPINRPSHHNATFKCGMIFCSKFKIRTTLPRSTADSLS